MSKSSAKSQSARKAKKNGKPRREAPKVPEAPVAHKAQKVQETPAPTPAPKILDTIRRLVMIRTDQCMICDTVKPESECHEITCGRLWGWVCCDSCIDSGLVKQTVLAWMKKTKSLPMSWLMNPEQKNFQSSASGKDEEGGRARFLQFFRYSKRQSAKPVHEAKYSFSDDEMLISPRQMNTGSDSSQQLVVDASFKDTETGEEASRKVTLGNIMAHNPGFYEALVQEKDLLCSSRVRVSYQEIDPGVKAEVERAHMLAQTVGKTEFRF